MERREYMPESSRSVTNWKHWKYKTKPKAPNTIKKSDKNQCTVNKIQHKRDKGNVEYDLR